MNFFCDICISERLAAAINMLEPTHTIVHLADKFPCRDVEDATWIRTLAREGDWVIISGDPRITRGREERRAWLESGLTAFFFGGGYASKNFWKQVEIFARWWPQITREAREYREGKPGDGYVMQPGGSKWKVIHRP